MLGLLRILLCGLTLPFGFYFLADVYKRRKALSPAPWAWLLGTGFVTNMFDALGVGSFAQQTAIFKFLKLVDDRVIPGTMNVGNTIPTVAQALIFMSVVPVSPATLASLAAAAPAGGVGFYAPCMATIFALGMHPKTAFPIMMTATAMLMAAGSARFVKEKAYDPKAALALTLFGVPGVLLAAYVVKSLPLDVMRWVVLGVVLYTSAVMFLSARGSGRDPACG